MNTGKSLLEQFQGSDGRQHLIDALATQPLVGDKDLAVNRRAAPQVGRGASGKESHQAGSI